jgi:Family of unknown function (DUF5317)
MKLVVAFLVLTIAVGYLLGGRLSNLASLKLRWRPLAVVGLALQFVTGPGDVVPLVCLYVSFVVLLVFTIKNIRVAGLPLVLLGLSLNFFVIGINGGMPVTRHALKASGQGELLDELVNNPYPKHHLASSDDYAVFLGDAIPIPPPVHQAISLGDIFTYLGVGVVIVSAMRHGTKDGAARPQRADELKVVEDAGL